MTCSEWKFKELGEIAEVTKLAGFEFSKYINYIDDGEIIAIRAMNVKNGVLDLENIKRIDREISDSLIRSKLFKGDIVLTYTGSNFGESAMICENDKYHLAPNVAKVTLTKENDAYFFFSYFKSYKFREQLRNYGGGSSQPTIPMKAIRKVMVPVPPLVEQKNISNIILSLDKKIELNNEMNKTLEEMSEAVFKRWFVDFEFPNEDGEPYKSSGGEMVESELGMIPKGWKVNRVDEISNVNIGKTPPRKESQWFSDDDNKKDIRWVSIKDLGNSGLYINKTGERLTEEAVKKFNVKRIPDNTVLLSFKLTVGRVAITVGEMLSNEAIAHFVIDDSSKVTSEYLYLYLKDFNYNQLGSTSSIATAINSKIVKTIPVILPKKHIIEKFQMFIEPIFKQIKGNSLETEGLIELRDSLLPKLMNGEIRVEDIEANL